MSQEELTASKQGRFPLSEQIFGKALISLTLALFSVQKKLEDANPLRKPGLRKRDLAHSNKISQHFNDFFFFLYNICLHQKIKIWK